jgi:predicted membrane-bound spermidine synthase
MSDPTRRKRLLFFAVFTVSGFSGLIYESIWSHYLKLFLGHAAYAQTLVLAIFMGGMALGSWLIAKYSRRIANLLVAYAIVEGIIGLLGLLFHKVSIGVTSWAFESVLPGIDSVAGAQFVKWSLGAMMILPQSILLGMTFPLMSGAIVRRFPQHSGETLAMLYFTNSIGAAVGVMVSGFVLIAAIGLPGTIMAAGMLNVLLALFVWGIAKYQPDTVLPAAPVASVASDSASASLLRWMMIGAGVTGAASFLYEIAWIRMLSLVLGSSTHAFEMMLSAFILGIALGGLWIHRRIDALSDPVRFLANVLMIMAVVAIASLPVYNWTFDLMAQFVRTFQHTEQGYTGFMLSSHAIAMIVMIPTTFFCGMTLPVMTNVLLRSNRGENSIGAIYACNTAGAILGVIVAIHILMPFVGVKGIVVAGALLQVLLAVAYRYVGMRGAPSLNNAVLPAVIGIAVLSVATLFLQLDTSKMTSGVFRHGRVAMNPDDKILFYGHGKTASISLTDIHGLVSIATNGKPDAAIRMKDDEAAPDEVTMVLLGAMPIALHAHPQRVANIGFGSGLSSHVALASPEVTSLDTIEIEPMMARAARLGFMPRVARTFEDPRSHIVFEDAKTFFAVHRKKYDVIVSEPSNPWVSGVASLFSDDFYRQITRYLEPDGMLVQWIQTYEADMDIVLSIVKAMEPHFADFTIYSADASNIVIVAVRGGSIGAPDPKVFSSDAMRKELARVGIFSVRDIEDRYLGNRELLLPLMRSSGVPANSDYFPFVDLYAARDRILNRDALEFNALQNLPVPFFELLQPARTARASGPTVGYDRPGAPKTVRDVMRLESVALLAALTAGRYERLSPNSARMVVALNSDKAACSNASVVRAWLGSAFFIAQTSAAVLSADDTKKIWNSLAATACAQALKGDDLQWFNFLRAAAERDSGQVTQIGPSLLKAKYAFADVTHSTFTVLETATSAVATGQFPLALETIRSDVRGAGGDESVKLAYRWLIAMALEKLQADEGVSREHISADNSRH